MAASSTDDGEKSYREVSNPDESLVNLRMLPTAQNFWVDLAGGEARVEPVREDIAELIADGRGLSERIAVLVNGWLAYPKIQPVDLVLDYDEENGVRKLSMQPTCGGIDLGPGSV